MKKYVVVEVQLHHFLPRHVMEVCGQPHAPGTLPLGKSPGIH
jgi:hypothetical protein